MHVLVSLNGTETCTYRKVCVYKRAVYGSHFFRLTSIHDRDVLSTATDPPWSLFVSFGDTVSGKETGN